MHNSLGFLGYLGGLKTPKTPLDPPRFLFKNPPLFQKTPYPFSETRVFFLKIQKPLKTKFCEIEFCGCAAVDRVNAAKLLQKRILSTILAAKHEKFSNTSPLLIFSKFVNFKIFHGGF